MKKSNKVEDLSKGVKHKTKTELVYIFLKKILNEWDAFLEVHFIIIILLKKNNFIIQNKPQEVKDSIDFQKKELGVFRSCHRNLKPLF